MKLSYFSTACLTVGEDSRVESLQCIQNRGSTYSIKDFILAGRHIQNSIEMEGISKFGVVDVICVIIIWKNDIDRIFFDIICHEETTRTFAWADAQKGLNIWI